MPGSVYGVGGQPPADPPASERSHMGNQPVSVYVTDGLFFVVAIAGTAAYIWGHSFSADDLKALYIGVIGYATGRPVGVASK